MAEEQDSRESMLEVLAQFRVLVRSIREHYRTVEDKASIGGAQLWALSEIAAAPDMSVGDLRAGSRCTSPRRATWWDAWKSWGWSSASA